MKESTLLVLLERICFKILSPLCLSKKHQMYLFTPECYQTVLVNTKQLTFDYQTTLVNTFSLHL